MAQARQRRVHVTNFRLAEETDYGTGEFLQNDGPSTAPMEFKTRAQAEKHRDSLKTKKKYVVVETRHPELR